MSEAKLLGATLVAAPVSTSIPQVSVELEAFSKLVAVVPPASLCLMPFLPACVAPFLSFWKLPKLPLAFVGWRQGKGKLPLFLLICCFFVLSRFCLLLET